MKKVIILVLLVNVVIVSRAQTFTSSDLPIITINTNGQTIPDDPKITADMTIIYNGPGVRNNLTDIPTQYNGKIGIEIRGQSSQMFPMKSYSIELRDALGNSQDKSLFGLPKESDWVLYAPYNDKTLMHNFLAYAISNEMGRWAAHCRFVEVMLNNEYIGIYVFMEKIKRGSGRVNIAKMSSTDITGDAVTGGYIFSLDKEPNGWFSAYTTPNSTTSNKRQYSFVYPKIENIVQQQKDYLKAYVDSFENAVAADNFQDPLNGVRRFADISSFVDHFIVNEISRNVDGYRLSAYFSKDRNSRNSKIFAGPVWDYDLAFHNADYCLGFDTAGWAYQFNYICPGDGAGLVPFYWFRLTESDTAFRAALRCRWKNLRQSSLSEQRINFLIDSIVTLTAEARQRHFQKWPVLGQYVWPNPQPIPKTYAEEITVMKQWIHNRLLWMDRHIPNTGSCADWIATTDATIQVDIYPNPVTAHSNIILKVKQNQTVQLDIRDMAGRLIHTQKITALAVSNDITNININRWAPGVYLFIFSNAAGEKVIKKVIR